MIIRKEIPSDIEVISELTEAAFRKHAFSQHTEQFIVAALRAAGALTLSLVAETDRSVVGHIAFSPVTFTDGSPNWYGIGPLSVRPEFQKRGVGQALMREGLSIMKSGGVEGCVLVGDPAYYHRFGFRSPRNLYHEGVPQENFMALSFTGRIPSGEVHFHEGFSATS